MLLYGYTESSYILYFTAKIHISIWNLFTKIQSNIAIWQYIAQHNTQ